MAAVQSDLVAAVRRSGVTDDRLLEAFRATPRADFVPPQVADRAYEDRPLPIPHGQVTTQPSLSARMVEALDLEPTDRVLEVGTGYGFQTALVARLAESVVSIERWADIAETARANLARHDIGNVDVRVGDGTLGVPGAAPFDAIVVSAAFPEVAEPLSDQLAEGGTLVQPIGPGGHEVVTLFRKVRGSLDRVRSIVPASFVPLFGREAYPDDAAP